MKKIITLLFATVVCCAFAARAEEDGGEATPKWYTANVQDANTLGTLLAAQLSDEETLASIQYLRLSGTLGTDDATLIKTALTGLVEVDMHDMTITEIPQQLFTNTSNEHQYLRRVVLPSGLTTIKYEAFRKCSNLEEVLVPETLTTIGYYAFSYTGVTTFDFAATRLATISYNAFEYTNLTQVHFPSTIQSIGSSAFRGCLNLTSLTFPSYVQTIGSEAFACCTALQSVLVPVIGDAAYGIFYKCSALTDVTLSEGMKTVPGSMFMYCTALESIVVPASVEKICYQAFNYCTGLTSIIINEGLKEIDKYAFFNCNQLTSIELPSTFINSYYVPFRDCSKLKTITVKSYLPPFVNQGLFLNPDGQLDVTLRVPRAALATYKVTEGWNTFSAYEAIDTEEDPYFPNELSTIKEISIVTSANQPAEWNPRVNLLNGLKDFTAYYSEEVKYEYGRLRVLGEEQLSISELNLTAHEYYRRSDHPSSAYSQLIPRTTVTADRVNLHVYFNSYSPGYISSWHFMAFPFDIDLADHNLNEQGHYYAIYEYDGERRANGENGWVRLPDDARLTAGKGYIFNPSGYVNGSHNSLEDMTFHAVASTAEPVTINGDDVTVDLTDYPSDYSQNAGWNFIGNPYLSYYDTRFIDFDGPITVRTAPNTYSSAYQACSLTDDSKILVPYEAFFVQRSLTADQLVFHKEGQQFSTAVRDLSSEAPARVRAANPDRLLVNLTLSGADFTDRTRVVLNPDASADYEPTCDASKFWAEDEALPQFCSVMSGIDYAINEMPQPSGDIALRTRTIPGRYTIALEKPVDNYDVELIDSKTGAVTDLTAGACEYDAEEGDSQLRFALRLTPGITGIEGIRGDNVADDDCWYNLQGIRLESEPTATGLYIHNGKKVIVK